MRFGIAVLAVLVVTIVAAGCGGNDTPAASPSTEWADGVCQALTTWKDAVAAVPDTLKNDPSKDGLEQAASDVKDATETLASDLKGLGRPDTEAGQAAQDTITTLADELTTQADTIKTTVEDASGLAGLAQAAPTVASSLTTMGTEVSSAVGEIEGLDGAQELKDSFAQAESCSALQGGS